MKIYDLANIPQELLGSVGGKAKGLCQLSKFGFDVPKGFILVDAQNEQDFEDAYNYYQEKGLDKVTASALAKEAGINRATFYAYFTDMDDLIFQDHWFASDR